MKLELQRFLEVFKKIKNRAQGSALDILIVKTVVCHFYFCAAAVTSAIDSA